MLFVLTVVRVWYGCDAGSDCLAGSTVCLDFDGLGLFSVMVMSRFEVGLVMGI